MYAVIETGGKQYRVTPGDVIRVDRLPAEPGEAGTIGRVVAVSSDDGNLLAGADAANAKVEGTVLFHGKAKKILVFHYKRKKQYKKTRGHRQDYTQVRVDKIVL